jgi:hypothetical protein
LPTKPFVHERVYPLDPNLTLSKLPPHKNESPAHSRHYFINRKQDRFTLSVRYAETGKNNKGKRWIRWKTLLTFSATYRQPESSSFPNLNLFYTGPFFGANIKGVINVTRNPALVTGTLPPVLISLFIEELEDLLTRNQKAIPYSIPSETFDYNLYKELNKLLTKTAYPLFSGSHLEKTIQTLPSFLTTLFRSPDLEKVCKYLKIDHRSELGAYLKENFNNLKVASFFALEASKGILNPEDILQILKIHENRQEILSNRNTFFKETSKYWDEVATEIPTLRGILRRMKPKTVITLLSSDYNNISSLNFSLRKWKQNHKILSSSSFIESDIPLFGFGDLSKLLRDEIEAKQAQLPSISSIEIQFQLEQLCSEKYLTIEKTNKWLPFCLTAKVGPHKMNILQGVPKKYSTFSEDSQQPPVYSIVNPSLKQGGKNSVIWKILKNSNFASMSMNNGPLFNSPAARHAPNDIMLSSADYLKFIQSLREVACSDLRKYKMESSSENIALYIATLFLFTYFEVFKKHNGVIPRKFFTLVKAGIKPHMAFSFLNKNISVNNAISMKDIPDNWVLKAIGDDKEKFNSDF